MSLSIESNYYCSLHLNRIAYPRYPATKKRASHNNYKVISDALWQYKLKLIYNGSYMVPEIIFTTIILVLITKPILKYLRIGK
jgi:hypothetical protein